MFVIIKAEGRLEPSQLLKADSRNSQESSPAARASPALQRCRTKQ